MIKQSLHYIGVSVSNLSRKVTQGWQGFKFWLKRKKICFSFEKTHHASTNSFLISGCKCIAVIDGLVTKKSMFSSKADGYVHDVILIFSWPAKDLHSVKNYIHAVVYFTIEWFIFTLCSRRFRGISRRFQSFCCISWLLAWIKPHRENS